MARFTKWSIPVLLTLFVSVAGIAFWFCLPEPLFDDPVSTILLSRDGQLLGAKIADDEQWRFPELETIPQKYKMALLQFEDRRFYAHIGFDPLAFARAVNTNLRKGRIISGGSTITMQVIRLVRKNKPRTFYEKFIEVILALRLELEYSKEQILILYASHAPFGGNVVGLEAAAWRYFGRSPDRLSWAESSMLAVLPNSPALINPGRNRHLLQAKRNRLLKKLKDHDELGAIELQLAELEPLPANPVALPRLAPHMLETLVQQVNNKKTRLRSTLSDEIQRDVVEAVGKSVKALSVKGINNVAALVVDNTTSEVLAYVGNSYHDDNDKNGYAVDIVQSPRSSGSTLKPFLFAAMLQAGVILPTTLVPDVPTQYSGYMPENFDRQYRGVVPAQQALARSLNVPAVFMLHEYGVDRFYDFLQHLGMSTLFRQPSEYGLTLILGGAESTLWDLTSMYSNLATMAKSELESKGSTYKKLKILQDQNIESGRESELSAATAWLTLNALVEVNRPDAEAHWKNFSSTGKVAWKTGTSYGLRDAWAIGVNGRYTVGVWAGNANGEGRPELTGVTAAAPIMFEVFNHLDSTEWFSQPLGDMKQVLICANDGYLANGNCESTTQWVPKQSHFEKISPYNKLVHLDKKGSRVHSLCESVFNIQHVNWFSLPPAQEYYFRPTHSSYRSLPKYRTDCQPGITGTISLSDIALLYPNVGTKFYIPVDLGAEKERVVFEAVHRNPEARLFWHLDSKYIGETQYFHQQALDIQAGKHQLVLVDEKGDRLVRGFEVLSTDHYGQL
ncbi:MAG: penicillin-binding protein 1C [Gammaproteobacteria bacterium]|nr:penicillin-binding protein 1C [Gammaproteobacteria bacterium]